MKKFELLVAPPLVMLLVGLLMWLLAIIVPTLNFAWLQNTVLAGVLLILGLLIAIVGVITFKRLGTTPDPKHPEQASVLVNSGIYGYSRNPMYLGVFIVLVGWAIYLGSLLSLIATLVFVIYMNYFQIIPEERILEEKFVESFQIYKKNVRRWI